MAGHVELEQRIRRLGASYNDTVPPTPGLERRIVARIAIPTTHEPPKPTLRRDIALAGALVLLVAAIAFGVTELRGRQLATHATPTIVSPSPTSLVTATPPPQVPAIDLDAAGLTSNLVTPLNIQATDQGRAATLIGGYADPARIILIFHLDVTGYQRVDASFSDDQGLINASSSGFRPLTTGDFIQGLDAGPHAGPDGSGHLTVTLTQWKPGNGPGQVLARWNFSVTLPIHPSTPIPAPSQFQLGHWKANIETLELTPIVVHLQALINGASVMDIGLSTVTLVDANGDIIGQGCGASITVPKTQIDSPASPLYHNVRVYCEFPRPTKEGTYRLRFSGGGGTFTIPVTIQPGPAKHQAAP